VQQHSRSSRSAEHGYHAVWVLHRLEYYRLALCISTGKLTKCLLLQCVLCFVCFAVLFSSPIAVAATSKLSPRENSLPVVEIRTMNLFLVQSKSRDMGQTYT
jgi:hypothetical protein